ncbi:hypothetical protein [Streptomyces sp. FH025]|uniref:hypothetical protein n=1 Tax=Streptomyces sp. FH025 TaxID=2815937 RepID=UPI001A9D1DDB|nr:hypothetical protein [Streptomyces sp. FH025]MBO1419940.1 hypothetical protein [Streptomyces sp. FH025]
MSESDTPGGIESARILLVDAAYMASRWDDVVSALNSAFAQSVFNDEGYTADNPVTYTRAGVDGKLGPGVKHLVVLDESDTVIGGWFCIQTVRAADEAECDTGWFFVVPGVDRTTRRQIVEELATKAFQTMRDAGFQRIVSNMGTVPGAKSMTRYGFVHEPTDTKHNRWTRQL